MCFVFTWPHLFYTNICLFTVYNVHYRRDLDYDSRWNREKLESMFIQCTCHCMFAWYYVNIVNKIPLPLFNILNVQYCIMVVNCNTVFLY